jgi:tetratricopeptide (TPR) repeat protein
MDISTIADNLFSSTVPTLNQYDSVSNSAVSLGLDLFTKKDYAKSIKEFKRAIAMSPYSDYALKAFGFLSDAYSKTGKTREAVNTLKQAMKVFPSDDSLNLKLGNLYYGNKQYSEAIDQYKAAVSKNTSEYDNVYSLGEGYLAKGSYADAASQFRRAAQIDPKNSGAYYGLGKAYHKMGQLSDAAKQLEKAISLKGSLSDAHYELGVVYLEQNKTTKAKTELNILNDQSSALHEQLDYQFVKITNPRIRAAYSVNINLASPAGTKVSTLDSSLETSGETKDFSVNFIFDKDMDASSVLNSLNWNISRSYQASTGGYYNWGLKVPETEVTVSPIPKNVIYDPDTRIAKITFSITQNADGNGTIDLSHLVFKFNGKDAYGNHMDTSADQYSILSKIV